MEPKGHGAQQQQFGLGIATADIGCGVGFGVTFLLRFFERLGVGLAALFHLRQDIVAGTVNDAKNGLRLFRSKALAQRANDRNAAADASLEAQLPAVLFRCGPNFLAEPGQNRLVRGNDRFTLLEGAQNVVSKNRQLSLVLKSESLDNNLHAGIVDDFLGLRCKERRAFGKPFLVFGTAGVDSPDLEIEIFPQLASTVFKDDILNRFAHNAGAKQPETDFAARTG